MPRRIPFTKVLASLVAFASAGLLAAQVANAEIELKIAYMKHPIHQASVDLMKQNAKKLGIKVTAIPMAYSIFQQKVTATLTSKDDQFDIIWHNDDWGQLWKKWVEPVDDVAGMNDVAKSPLLAFYNDDGKVTAVPMAHTVGTFFYRTDLVPADKVPTTWDELVKVSKELQDAGKVKWGYVGGMKMNNTWFTLWWTMWSDACDIFKPIYSRDNKVLEKAGWTPAITEPCTLDYMNFWWDAMNTSKISPKAMTSYGRDEANAIFMAGEAAFTLVDSTHYGDFNNPKKSRIAGKIGMAPFPMGPRRDKPVSWNEIWGWAIPKGISAEHKAAAKKLLGAMLTDIDGQVEMWKKTGGPPPNMKAWDVIAKQDPVFAQLKHAVFDQEHPMHAAYYFPNWPAVHKAYSDTMIKALSGAREDMPQVFKEGMSTIHDAAVQ